MSYDAWLEQPHQDAMSAESDADDFAEYDAERIEAELIALVEQELQAACFQPHNDKQLAQAITALAQNIARARSCNTQIVSTWLRDERDAVRDI